MTSSSAIQKILEILQKDVERYIFFQTGNRLEDKVILSNLINQDGSIAIPKDRVALTLVNIIKDGSRGGYSNMGANQFPPTNINLYIMFSAYFNTYTEALKHIEFVLKWFQIKPVYTPTNTPELPPEAGDSLHIDLVQLDFDQLSHLWGILGGKYLPSIVYQVRTITIKEDRSSPRTPSIGD